MDSTLMESLLSTRLTSGPFATAAAETVEIKIKAANQCFMGLSLVSRTTEIIPWFTLLMPQQRYIAAENGYFAPRPNKTTGTVFSKIFKSKSKDQLSM